MNIRPKIVMTHTARSETGQMAWQEKATYLPPWWQWPGWWLLSALLTVCGIIVGIALAIKQGIANTVVDCFMLTEDEITDFVAYSEHKD